MSRGPETLEGTIAMLRSFGPSLVLVRCLFLAGRREEARAVSEQVAAMDMARLAVAATRPIAETAELRLRTTFAEVVAGRRRNARVLLQAFVVDAERAERSAPGTLQGVAAQLAIAAIIVNESGLSGRVAGLLRGVESLPVRALVAIVAGAADDLRQCLRELNNYVCEAGIPPWSDTWHHVVAVAIAEALTD